MYMNYIWIRNNEYFKTNSYVGLYFVELYFIIRFFHVFMFNNPPPLQ